MLARDLEQYFQRSQPYLDPGRTRNQISYLLNRMLGQSFYQYVNQACLQHLLQLLETAVPPVRIDELAFNAGFNSLSAFYRCFRRHIGFVRPRLTSNNCTKACRGDFNRQAGRRPALRGFPGAAALPLANEFAPTIHLPPGPSHSLRARAHDKRPARL